MTRCLLCSRLIPRASYCATCKPKGNSRGWAWSKTIVPTVLARDGHRCVLCGNAQGPLDVDHIVQVAHGGTDALTNLRSVCRSWNRGGKCAS